MTISWRRAIAIFALAGVSLALGACAAGGGSADTRAADKFTVWWYESADSAMGIAWKDALAQFKAKHPGVDVTFELKTWDQLQQAGQMVLNSDSAPDLLEYPKGNATAGAVAKAGLITDLTDVAATRGWDKTVPASALTVGRYDANGVMGGDRIYGVPSYGEYVSLFYNADLLAKHHLKAPTTLAELEKVMQTFVDEGVTPLALGSADYPIVHLVYELALHGADRQWVDNFQFFKGTVDFHDANWKFAAETVAKWVQKGYISSDSTGIDADAAATGFKDGTYPLFLSGSWWDGDFAANADFKWSKELFPENAMNTGSGGNIWVVPSNSDAKDLAYDFIDITLSGENQALLGNSGGVAVAAKPSAVTDPVGSLAVAQFGSIVAKNGLAYYADWPVAGFYDVWLQNTQGLISGSLTPETFLDAIASFYASGAQATK